MRYKKCFSKIRTLYAHIRQQKSHTLRGYDSFLLDTYGFFGGPSGTRTLDPLIKSQVLYQLS